MLIEIIGWRWVLPVFIRHRPRSPVNHLVCEENVWAGGTGGQGAVRTNPRPVRAWPRNRPAIDMDEQGLAGLVVSTRHAGTHLPLREFHVAAPPDQSPPPLPSFTPEARGGSWVRVAQLAQRQRLHRNLLIRKYRPQRFTHLNEVGRPDAPALRVVILEIDMQTAIATADLHEHLRESRLVGLFEGITQGPHIIADQSAFARSPSRKSGRAPRTRSSWASNSRCCDGGRL